MRYQALAATLALAMFCLASAADAAISVDGSLADWGISNGGGNVLTYNQFGGSGVSNFSTGGGQTPGGQSFAYMTEDTNGQDSVGPGYGGQSFDAEFLGVLIDEVAGKAYIGIATGQRSDLPNQSQNPLQMKFEPGDIRLLASSADGTREFGVEVGGTAGDSEISLGEAGATFNLNPQGYATGLAATGASQTAGSLWKTFDSLDASIGSGENWKNGVYALPTSPFEEVGTQLLSGVLVGGVDAFKYASPGSYASGARHAFIELSVSLAALGLGKSELDSLTVAWMPSCANDIVNLTVTTPVVPLEFVAPEPGTMLVWLGLAGMAGLALLRRRRAV